MVAPMLGCVQALRPAAHARSVRKGFTATFTTLSVMLVVACDTPGRPSQGASDPPSGPGAVTSAENSAAAAAPVPFTGRVLDYQTGVTVSNATVRIVSHSYEQRSSAATTDVSGSFSLSAPRGFYSWSVDGFARFSSGTIRVTVGVRGDFFVNGGDCDSRYGVVTDLDTGLPIAGASVGGSLTETDGWYHWTHGCKPYQGEFGTRAMYVSHPNYESAQRIIGLGKIYLARVDVAMTPLRIR
jgi:hypothetical protein